MRERQKTCWKKISECQRLALMAPDVSIRMMYLDLVTQWRELADYSETAQSIFRGAATIH
jgi:hypothetical protein